MIHVLLVAVGAGAASVGLILACQRRWDWRLLLAFNVVASALAGAVAGATDFVSQESAVSALLSYGLFGTAAPFVSTLLGASAPRTVSEGWRVIRRSAGVLVANAVFCATAASATYMVIAGTFFYLRATH